MKLFNLLFAFSILMSCVSKKNAENNTENLLVKGVVHVSSDGCPVYIVAKIDGGEMKLYPVNLDDEFKSEGLKISFNYLPSRAMQPSNCIVDKVVSVENVAKNRR